MSKECADGLFDIFPTVEAEMLFAAFNLDVAQVVWSDGLIDCLRM